MTYHRLETKEGERFYREAGSRRADPAAALQLGIERRLAAGHEPSQPGLSCPGP